MRGMYTASYEIAGVSTARTLLYLTAPANQVVEIFRAEVTNSDNEANEQLKCQLQRISSLGTPTATTVTPAKHEEGDQAAVSVVKGNVTASEPSYAADTELGRQGAASLAGWVYDPTPEERPTVAGGASIGVRLMTTPGTPGPFNCLVSMTFRCIG